MNIRNASEADLPAITAIYNATIPSRMVTADLEPVTVADRLDWFNQHSPDKWPIWVVETDGEIAGWLSFQPFYNRPAYNATAEVSIYVAEQHRGQGIGKFLMEEAIKHCPQLGLNTLLGFIFAHNAPSLQLFKKYNFQQWGYFPKVAVLDGVERDLVILGLRLQRLF